MGGPFFFLICALLTLNLPQQCKAAANATYLITAERSGQIQLRDAQTLELIRTFTVMLPSGSAGINGVFSDPSGKVLYFNGPDSTGGGCCGLFALDLSKHQVTKAAGIWGSRSRRCFVLSGASVLRKVSAADLTRRASPLDGVSERPVVGRHLGGACYRSS